MGLYGTYEKKSEEKKNYNLPMPIMCQTDVLRLIRSDEIQSLKKRKRKEFKHKGYKLNPLKNLRQMLKLNPYFAVVKRAQILEQKRALVKKELNKGRPKSKPRVVNPSLDDRERHSRRDRQKAWKVKKATLKKAGKLKTPAEVKAKKAAQQKKRADIAKGGVRLRSRCITITVRIWT